MHFFNIYIKVYFHNLTLQSNKVGGYPSENCDIHEHWVTDNNITILNISIETRPKYPMHNKSPHITLIFLSFLLPQSGSTEELTDPQLTESDFFNDFPVVLTATRLKQSKKNSPIATTIIDREMIEASGFTEIVDLLRLAPGMLVNYENGHIGAAGYQFLLDRYRVRLQVLIDGMSIYTPSFGDVPWTQLGITIDDIERIEVIRGPSSASYGPNAMTGVISIITRHAALDKGMKLKINQGVNGRSEQFATIGNSIGDFDYKLSLGLRKDDGFKERYDSKNLAIVNFRGDYQATNNDTVTISLNNNTGDYQEDAPAYFGNAMPKHVKNVTYSTQQTKWAHSFSDGDNLTLNYYRQNFKDTNKYTGNYTKYAKGFVPIDLGATTSRDNVELTYSTFSDWYALTVGALYRKDNTISSQLLYNVDRDIITKQMFANTELHLSSSTILNLGLLNDNNDTGGTTNSPRIALNHSFDKSHTVRFSYAKSTRSPFALEEDLNRIVYTPQTAPPEYFTWWTDLSDLKPERIKSYDLGYIGTFNNNATEVDLRIYKNFLTDIIALDTNAGTGGFKQGDEFDIRGFEASVSHRFKDTKATFNYARTTISTGNLVHGDPIDYETGAPKDIFSLLVQHGFKNKVNGSLGYYYTGEYQQLCCETQQQDPRSRIDLTLTKDFKIGEYNSKIRFILQNAANDKVKTLLLNNYDRQGYISLSVEL